MHPGIGFDATGLRSDGSRRGTETWKPRFEQVRCSPEEAGRRRVGVGTLGRVALGEAAA